MIGFDCSSTDKPVSVRSATGALAQLTTVTGAELSLQIEELAKGTHYFALTTVDTQGLVSAQSSRIAVAVQ